MADKNKKLTEDKAALPDTASTNDNKAADTEKAADTKKSATSKKSNTNETFVAQRTINLGSNEDGSPKVEIKRGQNLENLSKDDQELYRKHKIII